MKLCNTFQSIDKVAKTSSSRNNVFSNFVPSYYSLLQLIQSVAVYWSGTRLSAAICSKYAAAAAAKSLQSCPTLCDPIDSSPPGSPVPGILQARTLEWAAISFSNAWKWKVKWSRSFVSDSQLPHGLQPTGLLSPWDLPGKSTGVGCHCLLHVASIKNSKNIWEVDKTSTLLSMSQGRK